MASKKRTGEAGSPHNTEMVKKPRKDDDKPEIPMFPFKEGIPRGPDDTTIKASFYALLGDIENFAQSFFIGSPYNVPQAREHKNFFSSLTSVEPRNYLKCEITGPKEKIIRAAIWNKLIDHLLGAPTNAFCNMPEEAANKNYSGRSFQRMSKGRGC